MQNCKRMFARFAGIATLAIAPLPSYVSGEEVYSQIVGAISLDIPGESDVVVSFPFKKSTLFSSTVGSSTAGTDSVVVGVGATLTANQFATGSGDFAHSHYLSVESGTLKGRVFSIVSNAANSITIDATGEDAGIASDLAASDKISVAEYWTLKAAYPMGVASVAETQPGLRTVEVIIPDPEAKAGSMGAEAILFFHEGAWKQLGKPLDYVADNYPLPPHKAFIIRNNSESTLKSYFFGEVTDAPLAIPLAVAESDDMDSFVSVGRPLDVAIEDLGLHDSGVFTETTDVADIQDSLLVYSLDAAGKNKKPIAEYYYYNSDWRKVGAAATESFGSGDVFIKPNMPIAVRKAKLGSAPATSHKYWVNEWSLPQS